MIQTATVTQDVTILSSSTPTGNLTLVLNGNTVVNTLGNDGNCETTTGWNFSGGTIATDTSNYVVGTKSIKATLTTSLADVFKDLMPRISNTKYYLISAYLKNGNTTNCYISASTDGVGKVVKQSSLVTSTNWTRVGLVVQPSDWGTGYTYFSMDMYGSGANGNNFYFDGVMVNEITSSEYASGASVLLLKYPYHNGIKSSENIMVKSIGKNLFNKSNAISGGYYNSVNAWITNSGHYSTTYIPCSPNTQYCINRSGGSYINYYDSMKNWISSTSTQAFTTPANASYFITHCATSEVDISLFQVELGSTSTTYEAYKESNATCLIELKSISSNIYDSYNCSTGMFTKNVSNWVSLSGNAFTWVLDADSSGSKDIYTATGFTNVKNANNNAICVKYNNKNLISDATINDVDDFVINGDSFTAPYNDRFYTKVSDVDSGWLESWNGATSFTGMTWGGLIKAYMNGWKLTTANTNVASCAWSGIVSGTAVSGSSGYTTVTTTIDTGFTPYQIAYQFATPTVSQYQTQNPQIYPYGSLVIKSFVNDIGVYNSGINISNSNLPISEFIYINKRAMSLGEAISVSTSLATIGAGGTSYTVSGATNGNFYEYQYINITDRVIPTMTYSYDDGTTSDIYIDYSKTNWQNNLTPLNATNLNHIETGVKNFESYEKELNKVIYYGGLPYTKGV